MLTAPSLSRSLSTASDTPDLPAEAAKNSFHALESQVGGHAGVLSNEDGSLIVKPALPSERAFYELLAQYQTVEDDSSTNPHPLKILASLTPKFLGTLRLEGTASTEVDISNIASGSASLNPPPEGAAKDDIVLENVAGSFLKPNIIDIKLGTILYDDEASEEKKERMIKTARNTTSFETGVRLTGFQVYDYTKKSEVNTPKSYGKSIGVSDLPEGIRRFFPTCNKTTPSGQGLPRELLLYVLRGILHDVKSIYTALAAIELRMVGGSLLIVYEADWEAVRSAIKAESNTTKEDMNTSKGQNETGEDNNNSDGGEDDGEEEEDGDDDDGPHAYSVKLIDFAHTKLTPGQGPDLGILKGIETTIRLLEGRIAELNTVSDGSV